MKSGRPLDYEASSSSSGKKKSELQPRLEPSALVDRDSDRSQSLVKSSAVGAVHPGQSSLVDAQGKMITKEDIEHYNEQKRFLEEYLCNIIEYETPFRQCFFFKNEILLRYVSINNAQNLMVYFGIYTILSKMNLLALLYWICLFRILRKNFKPNIFKA